MNKERDSIMERANLIIVKAENIKKAMMMKAMNMTNHELVSAAAEIKLQTALLYRMFEDLAYSEGFGVKHDWYSNGGN